METKQQKIDREEVAVITRFLLQNSFTVAPLDVVHTLSEWIALNCDGQLNIRKAYAAAAAQTKTSPDTFRARISYHVAHNYDKFAEAVKRNYGCDIGDFCGVKIFIEQATLVYCYFYK